MGCARTKSFIKKLGLNNKSSLNARLSQGETTIQDVDDENNSQNTRISSSITGSIMQKDYFIRRHHRKSSIGKSNKEEEEEDGGGRAASSQVMTLNKKSGQNIHGGSMIIENGRSPAVRNSIKEESVTFNNTLLRHNLMNSS